MLLTNKERLKFISYLRQNIESSRLIIEQMEKLHRGNLLTGVEKTRLAAWMVVAADLENTESFEISGEEIGDA